MNTATMSFEDVAAREEQFQLATYKKFAFAPERGRGAWVETAEGERYLDLYGGHAVCATGHCHPRVVAAIKEQAERLLFYSNVVYSEVRARAAEKLVGCAPAGLAKAFFCNSGTEANENAMRMARLKTGRERVITFGGGFHGRTADSISATFLGRYRELGRPNVPGHLAAEFGSVESVAALADETVAAVMLEPVQSMAGVRAAPPEFYRDLRRLCDERGMLLVYDEVQTGVGRTGEWFFAGSAAGAGVVPDVVTLAKALGSGVPVGACLTTGEVASAVKENDLGTTFGGGMLATAAVAATLEAIEEDGMLENARAVGKYLRGELSEVPDVSNVRGLGLLLGVEFAEPVAARVQKSLLERRIITGASSDPRVLRLLPPLCLTTEEAGLFIGELAALMKS
ncbi:MAG TPA: aminotransferase class III-fold pyridoxal phosphate-dependent enzyme [Pyrinomonadaceae bacterium]|nr:aminotransferase class III-fold pyridoxal phosphate-dependent enzyme [Pyrinomonadaceae bacterium]